MQKYLKKKIRDERGVYIAVYAKTPQELAQKVAERTEEIERRKQLAENPLVWQYAQTWYKLYTPRLSDSRKSDYAIAINRHICPIIGARHMLDVTPGDIADVMLPHLGANTKEANFNAAKRAGEQMADYFEKGDTRFVVNK